MALATTIRRFSFGLGLFALWIILPLSAHAQTPDWRESVGVFRVGYLIDGDQARHRARLEPFRLAMERATGLQVSLSPKRTLDQLIRDQAIRRIQYAVHSASSYATTETLCKCLELLAVPSDGTGAIGLHSVVLAAAEGNVGSLSDLKDKRLAVPAPPATITRTVALNELASAGFNPDEAFGDIIDVENPLEGWRLIQQGKADAVIGWSTLQGDLSEGYSAGTLRHIIQIAELGTSADISVLWQSRAVPYGPHSIRNDLPTPLKSILKEFLLTLQVRDRDAYEAVEPNHSGGFVSVNRQDFSAVLRIAQPLTE